MAAPRAEMRDVDADALEEAQVGRLADPRDDALDAELTAEQRRQEVLLVVVDDRHHDVAAADVLGLEQREVGAVAAAARGRG